MERLSKSAFKLRSGNKPSASKLMGVSPVKHTEIIKPESDDLGNVATSLVGNTNIQPINALSGLGNTRNRQIESSDQFRNMAAGGFGGMQRLGITSRFIKA